MSGATILAALPREVAGLVKGYAPDPALRRKGIHLYRLPGTLVVAAGMGSARVTAGVAAALAEAEVNTVISVGLAGACLPLWLPGQSIEARIVVDVRTGEKFNTDAPPTQAPPAVLATTDTIASVREKSRLAETYGAAMVDMEAATVARLAKANGLKFRAIKAISDAHDFELASLSRFEGKHGTFRTGHFALHTAVRPHHWRKTMALGRHSGQALAALERDLRRVVDAPQ